MSDRMGAMGVMLGPALLDALAELGAFDKRRGWQAQISERVTAIVVMVDGRNMTTNYYSKGTQPTATYD